MTRSARRAAERRKGGAAFEPRGVRLPNSSDALELFKAGQTARAEAISHEVLARTPNDVLAHQVLGVAAAGRVDYAIAATHFARVVALAPDDAEGFVNLANALDRSGRRDEAILPYRCALDLEPTNPVAFAGLSRSLLDGGRYGEAADLAQAFLAHEGDSVAARQNLSLALWLAGYVDEAIETIEGAAALAPMDQGVADNRLMYCLYSASQTEEAIFEAARAWGETMDRAPVGHPAHEFSEPARLRIGYVSGDLGDHPVGRQIEKVLEAHDRARVEVSLYATADFSDAVADRLRAGADRWTSLAGLDDEAAARRIAADGIHVLIDLSGHTANNRLGVFAHRPAPVQASWLGYFATTGLTQVDFVLRDPPQIPPDEARFYTERFWPLEDAAFGYRPAEGCPEVSALPALRNGHVTFGCFNNPAKIGKETVAAWARVLHRVPGSRMIVDRKGLEDSLGRDRLLALFAERGIAPDRLSLGASRGHLSYMARYAEVDVVLDTFPCNGATTTYESLWMGVPVVSRRWSRMVGHFAESILGPCGHGDWVSDDEDGYVETAAALASDLESLAALRARLRDDLASSPHCRPGDCARCLEDAFEGMWRSVRGPATPVDPREIEALQARAVAAFQAGDPDLTERIFRRVTHLAPDLADGFNNLGVTLLRRNKVGESIPVLERAVALDPRSAAAHASLGEALAGHGRSGEAVAHLRQALALDPGLAQCEFTLAVPLAHLGRFEEAFAAFERGAARRPEEVPRQGAVIFGQLGNAFATYSRFEESVVCFAESIKLLADPPEGDALRAKALYSVGISLQHAGRVDEAVAWFERATELCPDDSLYPGSLAWCLQYSDRTTAEDAAAWAKAHAARFAPPALAQMPEPNRNGPRKLRIGLLSPEFRDHPVGYVVETMLKAHDRAAFEFFLYANVGTPDRVSQRLFDLADGWRDIARLDDDAAAALIRRDGIDILLDLVGYTENHRIGVFARKPAPIQAQWLGYWATSGLPQMDYFIVNPLAIPPEEEACYVERPMRVAGRAFCYEPPSSGFEVSPLPALAKGYVTFGTHNYLAKVTTETIRVWSEVLKAVPDSRLRLNRQAFLSRATRDHFLARFEANGVDRSRVDLLSTHSHDEHMAALGELDIMLDTFPFNGGTSTYEALWMGLPVVTMASPRMVGHFGECLLEPLGHGDWVARTPEEYVATAARLAGDLPALAALRAGLRDRLVHSPLCDAKAYAAEMEDAYRRMWAEKTA